MTRATESLFKDHFSGHATSYAAYRPMYPDTLFDFLADCCVATRQAWDCATGSGQTALALARLFDRVIATDASAAQIDAAKAHSKIDYRVVSADASGLAGKSVDLVTVSQALHWFNRDRFFEEAQRVLVARGVLAVWCYGLCKVDPACDEVILGLYRELDAYWPPERRLVEEGYRNVLLPMPAIAAPDFSMTVDWTPAAMLGYLRTWSASQRCLAERGVDPVLSIEPALRSMWGSGAREVCWPLSLKIGRA